jgi:hypothetical protein
LIQKSSINVAAASGNGIQGRKDDGKIKKNDPLKSERIRKNEGYVLLYLSKHRFVNILAQRTKIVQKRETQSTIFCFCLFVRESLIDIVLLGGDGNTSKKRRQQNSSGNGIQEKTTAKLKRNYD